MMFSNYHTHTCFCDGSDSPEELVLEAIRLGCPEIGFSGHSFLPGQNWCMTETGTLEYCDEIHRLQTKYKDNIKVRLGIEQDIRSEIDRSRFEYIIGAVHYVPKNGRFYSVDESRESFIRAVNEAWAGDYYAFAEDYYTQVADMWDITRCAVVAHFDLLTKYNEGQCLFRTDHPRYMAAADQALDRLIQSPCLMEINTGAIARGYRTEAYPEKRIVECWLSAGKELLLSADCHQKSMLLCCFEKYQHLPHREVL